jgi:MoxR-like ATPase
MYCRPVIAATERVRARIPDFAPPHGHLPIRKAKTHAARSSCARAGPQRNFRIPIDSYWAANSMARGTAVTAPHNNLNKQHRNAMSSNSTNPFANIESFIRTIAKEEAGAVNTTMYNAIQPLTASISALRSDLKQVSGKVDVSANAQTDSSALSRKTIREELARMAEEARAALASSAANSARPYSSGPDSRFTETLTAGNIKRALATAKAADRYLVIVSGPAGSGKTYPSLQIALRSGRPVYPVEISEATTLDDLFVRPWTTGPATMGWVEGPAVRAAREGGVLLLDECDLASPRLIGGLHGLLESGQTRLRSGEWLQAHPNFVCIATCNSLRSSKGSYSTHAISTAFADRAVFVASDYLSKEDEVAILSRYGSEQAALDTRDDLVELRKLFDAGQLRIAPSTRRGAVVVAALTAGASRAEAWHLAMVGGLDSASADAVGRKLAAVDLARSTAELERQARAKLEKQTGTASA